MIEKLAALTPFRAFPEESLPALAKVATVSSLDAGDVLFREGDPGNAIYVVESGEVEIRKGERILARLRDGQTLGEMALLEEETRSADAVATRPTRVYGFDRGAFRTFLHEHPACGALFFFDTGREMSRRLRRTSEYLETVFEVGKIVGAGLPVGEMGERILARLLADIAEATGARMLLRHPLAEDVEELCVAGACTLDTDSALALLERHAPTHGFQETADGVVLGAVLENERGEVMGCVFLEKRGDAEPFSVEQAIVLEAVAYQAGLGILGAWVREEEEARRRLERHRQQGY